MPDMSVRRSALHAVSMLALLVGVASCGSTYDRAYQAETARLEVEERQRQRDAYDEASRYAAVVYFSTGSAVIDEAGYRELDWFVEQTAGAPPGTRVLVQGFADATGGESVNQQISDERARAVARYLESRGVPAGAIVVQGFASNFPAAGNATAADRRSNRRVEVTLE